MDSICTLCFTPSTLLQVPGYNIPTCVQCSEHLTSNGVYQTARADGASIAAAAAVSTHTATQVAAATQLANGVNNLLQQQQLQQQQLQQQQPQSQTQTQSQQQQQPTTQQTSLQNTPTTANSSSENLQSQDNSEDVDLIFNEEGSCPLCNKTFSRKSSLITHIRNHGPEKKFVCTVCNKGFTRAHHLREHERIHTDDRPYVCTVCNKGFTRAYHLRQHGWIHTDDRPYVCLDCGKKFTQKGHLNNHRRLHTGERPFVCIEPECGRSYAYVESLNYHMKTHYKVQQYCCNQCPKKFRTFTSLNQHLQAHGGKTGYYCPRCPDKTFEQQSQLHTHMKSHGLAFPYECSKCDEKFLQQAHLDQHLKKHDEFNSLVENLESSDEISEENELPHCQDNMKVQEIEQSLPSVKKSSEGKTSMDKDAKKTNGKKRKPKTTEKEIQSDDSFELPLQEAIELSSSNNLNHDVFVSTRTFDEEQSDTKSMKKPAPKRQKTNVESEKIISKNGYESKVKAKATTARNEKEVTINKDKIDDQQHDCAPKNIKNGMKSDDDPKFEKISKSNHKLRNITYASYFAHRKRNDRIILYTPQNRLLVSKDSIKNGRVKITKDHLAKVIGEFKASKFMKYYQGPFEFKQSSTIYYKLPNAEEENYSSDSDVDPLDLVGKYGHLYEQKIEQ